MSYMTKISLFAFKQIKQNKYARFFYTVHHSEKRGLFYIKLDDTLAETAIISELFCLLARAVLQYKADGRILDMQAINVPYRYTGQGLARLLAESAFTYAILNYYYMYLTCNYLQKYYLAIKNPDLEDRIVGPPHILEGPDSEPLDPNLIYELPEPEDFLIYSS